MKTRTSFLLLACGILSTSCADEQLLPGAPNLAVCASATDTVCVSPLHLGAFAIGATHPASVVLRNDGNGVLEIEDAHILSGANVTIGAVPATVARFAEEQLPLTLTPTAGDNTARLVIISNDPDTPRLEFDITFTGVSSSLVLCPTDGLDTTPEGCSETLSLRFAILGINQTNEATVLVRNTGATDLQLADATITDGSSTPGELGLATQTSAGLLPARADSPMTIRYSPRDLSADELRVDLEATDADGATYHATLSVTAGAPGNLPPVADVVEFETSLTYLTDRRVDAGIWLDGRGSHDPEGDPLQFAWRVTAAPTGSTTLPESAAAKLTRFAPDLLGQYEVSLEVQDALGNTDIATAHITVDPELALTIKINWGDTVGDVDLHVVPSGHSLFGPLDCYFQQPTIDWGAQSQLDDDPRLLVDDVSGSGSERVVIARPANGIYEIYANYFEAAGSQAAAVTVEVLADDETISHGTASRSLVDTCDTWKVGTIAWPSRTFTPAATANSSQCFGGTP